MPIRQATEEDLPELTRLFNDYRVFYKQPSDPAGAEAFLKERMERGESQVLVAEGELGGLAGFTQLYPMFSSVGMTAMYILNDLFVDDNHRRQGIARALLDAAVDFARQQGAAKVLLETGINNAPARALYEAAGWELITETCFYEVATGAGGS